MAIDQACALGDSLWQSLYGFAGIQYGGQGGALELAFDRVCDVPGVGPRVSSGICGCWDDFVAGKSLWSFSAGYVGVVGTDTFDRSPGGGSAFPSAYGNGATRIQRATLPVGWGRTAVGFALYLVDKSGSGDPSYSINGGTYTALGQTWAQDNKILKCYIPVAAGITPGSTIDFRCATAAGTAVDAFIVGIEFFWLDPTLSTTKGFIFHNLAITANQLATVLGSTNGDRLAILDPAQVKLGTGWNQYSPFKCPNDFATLFMYINDFGAYSVSTFGTNVTSANTKALVNGGKVAFLSPWEIGGVSSATQATFRDKVKALSGTLGYKTFDFRDEYARNGMPLYTDLEAAGIITIDGIADGIHPSAIIGNQDQAERLVGFLRTSIFTQISENRHAYAVGGSSLGSTTDTFGGQAFVDQTTGLGGIAPTSAVGALQTNITVPFGGIAPTSAVGSLQPNPTAVLTGIAPTSAVGSLQANPTAPLAGIAPTSAVGTLSFAFGGVSVVFAGIAPTSAVGSLTLHETVMFTGIASTAAVGALSPAPGNLDVALAGIAPTSAVGDLNPVAATPIDLAGIAPTSAVGSLSFDLGAVTVTLTGIPPTSAVGSLSALPGGIIVSLTGIAPSSGVGDVSGIPGPVTVTLTGISSTSAVGTLEAIIAGIASLTGIASTAAVGTLTPSTTTFVGLSGIIPTSAVGTLTAAGPVAQQVTFIGIAPTSTVGGLTFGGRADHAGSVTVRPGPSARVAVRRGPTVTVAVGGAS